MGAMAPTGIMLGTPALACNFDDSTVKAFWQCFVMQGVGEYFISLIAFTVLTFHSRCLVIICGGYFFITTQTESWQSELIVSFIE